MKFLCENCKAKYQIADEKVAGRTVRMKCRKCGHMIEVEASVTETSPIVRTAPSVDPSRFRRDEAVDCSVAGAAAAMVIGVVAGVAGAAFVVAGVVFATAGAAAPTFNFVCASS